MRKGVLAAVVWLSAANIASADDFCVVANGGRVCGYSNYNSCLSAAARQNGACIVQASPAPSYQSAPALPLPEPRMRPANPGNYNFGGSVLDGFEAGRQDLQARQALLTPPPSQQRSQSPLPPPPAEGTWTDAMTAAYDACGAIMRRGLEHSDYQQAQPYLEAFRICRDRVEQEYRRWRP